MSYESDTVENLVDNGIDNIGVIEKVVRADGGNVKDMYGYLTQAVRSGVYKIVEREGQAYLIRPQ